MSNVCPSITTTTLVTASAGSGASVINLQNVDRASLQLAVSGASLTTATITLKASLDGTNYNVFATTKTLAVSGATNGWFDLGSVNYPYLQVSWTAPAAGVITIAATLYSIRTLVENRD